MFILLKFFQVQVALLCCVSPVMNWKPQGCLSAFSPDV